MFALNTHQDQWRIYIMMSIIAAIYLLVSGISEAWDTGFLIKTPQKDTVQSENAGFTIPVSSVKDILNVATSPIVSIGFGVLLLVFVGILVASTCAGGDGTVPVAKFRFL